MLRGSPLEQEKSIFASKGFMIVDMKTDYIENHFSESLFKFAKNYDQNITSERGYFFTHTHEFIEDNRLNDFRLSTINHLNETTEVRDRIFFDLHSYLHELVGRDLAIQRRINLNIHYPSSDTTLMPLHTDDLMGNSPFELIVWVPLTPLHRTQSMYLFDLKTSQDILQNFNKYERTADILEDYSDSIFWPTLAPGQALLFSSGLFHGNTFNQESISRWSINFRIKNLFTPYGEKDLSYYFEPMEITPVSQIGLKNRDRLYE